VQAVNAVRGEYGLTPLEEDGPHLYTDGDHVLYPEPPGLVPMGDLPANHHLIGPILWAPDLPLPAWWDELPADRPLVYLTLGSTGALHIVSALIDRLAQLPVSIVVATAGRIELSRDYANVRHAALVPGLELCRRADVVVCSGGSATAYQAVAQGTPVVGIWSNNDQYLTSRILADHGAAVLLSSGAPVGRMAHLVQTALSNRSYAANASRVSTLMRDPRVETEFPALVDSILAIT
jgi:UDP:flavonoid glycosyltransferase YjiC (YdhE family)